MPWQLQLGLHRVVLSLLSISASQTRDRPLASCLPSEQLLFSEPSISVDGHQMHYPSWQPPWLNTSNTAAALQQESGGTQVPTWALG